MTIRNLALSGAAAVALAGLLGTAPVYAHTSQPATPQEIQQTDALNAQALANAQGSPSAQMTAAAAPEAAMPASGAIEAPVAPEVSTATPANAAVTPLTAMAT